MPVTDHSRHSNQPPVATDTPTGTPSTAMYEAMINNTADIMCLVDREGRVVFINSAINHLSGFEPAELIDTVIIEKIHPDDQQNAVDAIARLLQGSSSKEELLYRFQHKAGGWAEFAGIGRAFSTAGIDYVIVNSRDIREQQETLRRLDLSNQVLLKTFNATQLMLSISRLDDGKFVRVNPEWLRIMGYQREEAIGHTAIDLNIWGTPENRRHVISSLQQQGFLRDFKACIYPKDGSIRDAICNAEIIDVNGDPHVLFSARDVTESKQMEMQLRQSQKMEALGQLTGGVAHDFNNLLNVVQSGIELMTDLTTHDSAAQQIAATVQRAVDRGAALTGQLLAFSRRQYLRPEILSLDRFFDTLGPLLKTTLGDNIDITINCEPDAWQCLVDPVQFETAILNLVINARDAMINGGTLSISISNTRIQQTTDAVKAGDYVEVVVQDNGTGMSQEQIDQAFEPFYTTKDVGKGTGLGLSMVFGFLNQSDGYIELSSSADAGTRVCLLLPRANAPAITAHTGPTPHAPLLKSARGEHILLLEDDDDLRRLTLRVLKNLGYQVSEAASHPDVNRLLASGTPFDLMLSDVLLPGPLKGPQIAEQVRARQPDIQLLFMSGYVESSEEIDASNLLAGHFLPKPFSQRDLAEKLRSLLDPH